MFGLIAEEVAKVSPDLAVRNANGEVIGIRFDSINAMLLNGFLKEHRKVEELKKRLPNYSRAAAKTNTSPHGTAQRAGSANPEGERAARHSQSVRWRT
jgi:hypothetical protein